LIPLQIVTAMMSNPIVDLKAYQIYDSRGRPTVEVRLATSVGVFVAAVPSGASKGKYEALELRDGSSSRFEDLGTKEIA
jgi:enolase